MPTSPPKWVSAAPCTFFKRKGADGVTWARPSRTRSVSSTRTFDPASADSPAESPPPESSSGLRRRGLVELQNEVSVVFGAVAVGD